MAENQAAQKSAHDRRAKEREFHVGQEVMVKNLRPGPKYVPGVVVERQGPLSYLVSVQNGINWRRHVDHLKELGPRPSGEHSLDSSVELDIPLEEQEFLPPPPATTDTAGAGLPSADGEAPATQPTSPGPPASAGPTSRVYPSRSRQPPDRYGRVVTH